MTLAQNAIKIENKVLGADTRRDAIDQAVRDAFAGVGGEWSITLSEFKHLSAPWWRVAVHGEAGAFEVCLRPPDQDADGVRRRLAAIVRARTQAR